MAYQFAAVAFAVDCPAFVRAVAILSSTYIGFFWFLLIVEAAIKGIKRVFFYSACYQKRVWYRILLASCKRDCSGQFALLLLEQHLSQGLKRRTEFIMIILYSWFLCGVVILQN